MIANEIPTDLYREKDRWGFHSRPASHIQSDCIMACIIVIYKEIDDYRQLQK